MRKARSILNGRDTPCLFQYVATDNIDIQRVCKAFLEQKKINFMFGRCSTEEIDGYSDFIFLAKTGRPLMPHTACTNMARQGMSIKVLQYLMGHAHSDVTMDVYNHIAGREDVREEVERYALAVGG